MLLIPLSNISSNRADRDLKEDACLCQEVSAPLWGPVGQIHELRPRGRRQPEIAVSQIKRILRRHSLSLSIYLSTYLPYLLSIAHGGCDRPRLAEWTSPGTSVGSCPSRWRTFLPSCRARCEGGREDLGPCAFSAGRERIEWL